MNFQFPTVIPDIDQWISSIDGSIRLAADSYLFSYDVPVNVYDGNGRIPGDVYAIVDHYTKRGFVCVYDGVLGTLKISWNYPNMSYQDVTNTTRASPELILTIGDGFPAHKLYLCMTNGNDLRKTSDITLSRYIQDQIFKASTNGDVSTIIRFEGIPRFVIDNLFSVTWANLVADGYAVAYDDDQEGYVITWTLPFPVDFHEGDNLYLRSMD